ncbi:MAG: hypothetical protein NVSMB32_00280 [Actinomycetota bacterium]
MTRCAVLGAGAWGTALADLLARNGHDTVLWAFERVFTGARRVPHGERASVWIDLSWRELAAVVPLIAMAVVIGVYPKPFTDRIEPSVRQAVHGAAVAGTAPSGVPLAGPRP